MSEYDLIKKLAKKEHQQRSRARRERDREEKRATKIINSEDQ